MAELQEDWTPLSALIFAWSFTFPLGSVVYTTPAIEHGLTSPLSASFLQVPSADLIVTVIKRQREQESPREIRYQPVKGEVIVLFQLVKGNIAKC